MVCLYTLFCLTRYLLYNSVCAFSNSVQFREIVHISTVTVEWLIYVIYVFSPTDWFQYYFPVAVLVLVIMSVCICGCLSRFWSSGHIGTQCLQVVSLQCWPKLNVTGERASSEQSQFSRRLLFFSLEKKVRHFLATNLVTISTWHRQQRAPSASK